jgi:hypothetical protein
MFGSSHTPTLFGMSSTNGERSPLMPVVPNGEGLRRRKAPKEDNGYPTAPPPKASLSHMGYNLSHEVRHRSYWKAESAVLYSLRCLSNGACSLMYRSFLAHFYVCQDGEPVK